MAQEGNDTTATRGVSAAQAIANAALAEAMKASGNKDKSSRAALESHEEGALDKLGGVEGDEEEVRSIHSRSPLSTGHGRSLLRSGSSTHGHEDEDSVQTERRRTNPNDETNDAQNGMNRLHEVWHFALEKGNGDLDPKEAEKRFHKAYDETLEIVGDHLDSIIQEGLKAYKQVDQLKHELTMVKETSESKDHELKRLRETDANHQKTIQNLLRAVAQSKTDAMEAAKTALVEVELRAEIQAAMAQKGKAEETASDCKRKYSLIEDELRQIKVKLSKVEQEKINLERDRNATMSWAKSVDNSMSSDCEFYKRKVTEQNTHIQGLNAVIAEKNSQIQEMRRQIERSMSNNRLAQFRAATSQGTQHSHLASNKRARKRATY